MNKVYLLCEDIDMGYHVHGVYADERKANEECDRHNANAVDAKIQGMIRLGYSPTQAKAEAGCGPFWVDPQEIIE